MGSIPGWERSPGGGNSNPLQYSSLENSMDRGAWRVTVHAGDTGSMPGLGRSPGGGNSNPLQYSCLENPLDRGTWWAIVHRITKSWARLSDLACTQKHTRAWSPARAGPGLCPAASGCPPGSLGALSTCQTPVYMVSSEKGHLWPPCPAQPFQYTPVPLFLPLFFLVWDSLVSTCRETAFLWSPA